MSTSPTASASVQLVSVNGQRLRTTVVIGEMFCALRSSESEGILVFIFIFE